MKRPTAQRGGARMKRDGDTLSLFSLSLSSSLSFIYTCVYVLQGQVTVIWPSDDCPTIDRLYICIHRSVKIIFSLLGNAITRTLVKYSTGLRNNNTGSAWQSADGRVTFDHCRVTVQWLFSTIFPNCLKRPKPLFDSRPTVAWPPTTVAWPFSDFFSKIFLIAWNVEKIVISQSADGRVNSDHCCVTVQWLYFQKFPDCLKRPKNVVWQSDDGRVTSNHCRVTVQRLFSKIFLIAWNV